MNATTKREREKLQAKPEFVSSASFDVYENTRMTSQCIEGESIWTKDTHVVKPRSFL
jgi:hypothetical protein